MAMPAGAVYEQRSFQRCTLSGLSTMKGRLVTLQELRRGLETSAREVDAAQTETEIASAALFGLKLIKASCDAFISITGELGGRPLKMLSAGYEAATPLAENSGRLIAGGRVVAGDWIKAATTGVSAATDVFVGGPIADVVELHKIKSDIVVDAVNGDVQSVIKSVFVDYLGKVTSMSMDYVGKEMAAKYFNVGRELAETGYRMAQVFEEYRQNRDPNFYLGQRRFFQSQLFTVQQQIDLLKVLIARCEAELAPRQSLS